MTVVIVDPKKTRTCGTDERYAVQAAKLMPALNHSIVRKTPADLIQQYTEPTIRSVRCWGFMKTRNSLIISAAFEECARLNLTDVLVGDNADEILAGSYDCYFDAKYKTDEVGWKEKRDGMADLPFVTEKLAKRYNVTVHQPFRDPLLLEWALKETTRSDCVAMCVPSSRTGEDL